MDSPLVLTFDEAHARYSPPPGTGMTLPRANAFLRRYSWHLQRTGERVVAYVRTQRETQAIWLHEPDDEEQVRLMDAAALVRHANQIPGHDWTVVGYVHYRASGGAYHAVQLRVHWATETIYASWQGPIRPPDWGEDMTLNRRER